MMQTRKLRNKFKKSKRLTVCAFFLLLDNVPTSVLTATSLPPISERVGLSGERLYVCQDCNDAVPINKLSACLEHGKFACLGCMVIKHKACNSRGCREVKERKQILIEIQQELERLDAQHSMTQEYETKLTSFNRKVCTLQNRKAVL